MADGVALPPSGVTAATDDCGAAGHAQLLKLAISANGDATLIPADTANGMDVDVTRVQGPVTVDSEIAAGGALSDALDRAVSTGIIGAAGLADNGTNLVRVRTAAAAGGTTGTGLLGAGMLLFDGTNYQTAKTASSLVDAGGGAPGVVAYGYSGTAYERWRNNAEATALASAARTGNPTISNIPNYNARGVRLFLNITATPNNAETLTVSIEWVDPVSAAVKALTAFPATPAASTLGATPAAGSREFVYELYPGSIETAAVANHEVQGGSLPRTLHPKVAHSSTGSWTYSLGYGLVL